MAATSSAALSVTAAAAALLMAMALQLIPAAAATAPPSLAAPIGQPNCNTSCGDVSVPYPFGFGPSRCYMPGFNLTCDTSRDPPRLLLGDGSLRVTDISLENGTVRVINTGSIINATGDLTSSSSDGGWRASFGRGFNEYGYLLSRRNELVVFGCNVMAVLHGDIGNTTQATIAGCASFCPKIGRGGDDGPLLPVPTWGVPSEVTETSRNSMPCSFAGSACCLTPLGLSSRPSEVEGRWLYGGGNHTAEQAYAPLNVFVAEEGWVDMNKEGPLLQKKRL